MRCADDSKFHRHLKNLAIEYLKKEGYIEDEIIEEYPIQYKEKDYYFDVVGIKNRMGLIYTICFECGSIQPHKAVIAINKFNEVLWIPKNNELIELKGFIKKGR